MATGLLVGGCPFGCDAPGRQPRQHFHKYGRGHHAAADLVKITTLDDDLGGVAIDDHARHQRLHHALKFPHRAFLERIGRGGSVRHLRDVDCRPAPLHRDKRHWKRRVVHEVERDVRLPPPPLLVRAGHCEAVNRLDIHPRPENGRQIVGKEPDSRRIEALLPVHHGNLPLPRHRDDATSPLKHAPVKGSLVNSICHRRGRRLRP